MKKLLGLLAILAIAAVGFVYWQLRQPYRAFGAPVMIEFPRGTSTSQMASMLADNGVIRSPWLFLAARAFRRGVHLQAGEYQFTRQASPLEVYSRIARGDIYYMQLQIPEGFNMFDVANAVAKLGTMSADAFLAAARDPSLIRDLDPDAPTLEGYLFPSTYRILPKTTARQICKMMTDEFRVQWKNLAAAAHAPVHDTVTLASLVEREARLAQERTLVASVFQNRLRLGMKLDCDPTTVYAALLDGRYTGAIHQSDLASENPYNTYTHAGLPPGPIANPGIGSITAALTPTVTPYLYFVARADGSGGHTFSESLQQHQAAVTHYRRAVANH
ncbi:MAG TPA: endolytic transglycosylase MltG [Bryobacteraceae bacterium]|nr:endolytic transglycosylase MltG [Bryobacteraceae bacterium]